MNKFYFRVLQLLIEKPILNIMLNIGVIILIQIISIRVILAEEYYHPLMGSEIVQQKIDTNKEVFFYGPFMKKYELYQENFYIECEKIFNLRMSMHMNTLMKCNIEDMEVEVLDTNIIQAYYEITRKFHHFYLDSNNKEEMAAQCINFCKKYIAQDAWNSSKSISNLTNVYLILSSKLVSDEQKAEALFLHAVISCYKANTQNVLGNDTIVNVIFLQRLLESKIFQPPCS